MKKILILLAILNILIIPLHSRSIFAIEGKEHFNNFNLKNASIEKGKGGKAVLQLKECEYSPTPDTDLLIHFNDNSFTDESGNYTIKNHYNNISSKNKKYGNASSYFFKDKGISFSSNGESMFNKGRILGDFSIEFWIYPTIIGKDTTLFSWKGVNKVEDQFVKQILKSYFEDRQVVWTLDNIFTPYNFLPYSISLKSKTKLIPNRWSHHLLRYSSETGVIEYLMNGVPEDIKFTTPSYEEEPEIYSPYIGNFSKNEVFIGERFRGFIDELRISESYIKNPVLYKYKDSGYFESNVYDISGEKISITGFNIKDNLSSETDISYYFRISDVPFLSENNSIKWNPVAKKLKDVKGRYIQFYGILQSNGDRNMTPSVEKIEIEWNTITRPPAPAYIETKAGLEYIELNWLPVKHFNVSGYYIYIGDKSGNYQEIIDVGNVTNYTLENLTSKKIYYMSIKSYNNDRESEFSSEVYNRPE